ncbi:hypothetical protein RISK_001060 [Rhodopirellula islandica]|uniref:Uncharacterized protein n=1 Tax=Rhodopirellula islandica TaxID=595434 RepID=A0A0J1EP42_RHOIS|nr:hypothetical protein RISK_001060 [Rhodopirellula islandica]
MNEEGQSSRPSRRCKSGKVFVTPRNGLYRPFAASREWSVPLSYDCPWLQCNVV